MRPPIEIAKLRRIARMLLAGIHGNDGRILAPVVEAAAEELEELRAPGAQLAEMQDAAHYSAIMQGAVAGCAAACFAGLSPEDVTADMRRGAAQLAVTFAQEVAELEDDGGHGGDELEDIEASQ